MSPDDREQLTELARSLVRIESANPPGNEGGCATFIADWYRDRGIDVRLVREPFEDRPQVVAQIGDGDPTIVLNGHTDVVPVTDESAWTHDPYGGEVVDGVLYGRGSADMKAGLAIAMLAMLDLEPELKTGTLDGSVIMHGAIGEETGEPGTRRLLERGFGGTYGIVLEPTELRVATAAKGLAVYELAIPGQSSHASRPDQGINPIPALGPLVRAVDAYDDHLRTRRHELVGRSYATLTQCVAGADSNVAVLPDRATAILDRRMLPDESIDDVDEEVVAMLAALEREHGVSVEWRRIQQYAPASVPVDCTLATELRTHSAAIAGTTETPWGIEAATDVRNLVHDGRMDAVTWGPGSLQQAHTADEHIDLAQATAGLEILTRTIRSLLP